uniref:Uncharacterized protein AlNc14C13G1522 n=1 Tax=Albugo laibachii Nc14 TaxID=890382 RepID=F0W3F4_9STRA|nr:conserved hypothetical protein [Albugo laibachii Nc14]CCA16343.1 conserved hypothetical protein [Albugo laibachii Nc14]|eukprot:CCA16343.1 conserved hypothetical protein [Albugo laibachii Nc14]
MHKECAACGISLSRDRYSRSQWVKEHGTCARCVMAQNDVKPESSKQCVQCFQHLPKKKYSKRQFHLYQGKCIGCVRDLGECLEEATNATQKWTHDCYYRVCYRGKQGVDGVGVRSKCDFASIIIGYIPFGRVFQGTDIIYNEKGDPMINLSSSSVLRNERRKLIESAGELVKANTSDGSNTNSQQKKNTSMGWVPYRSIRNEIMVEKHRGPFEAFAFYQCVIEGCKVRSECNLELQELGYLHYGDVLQIVKSIVNAEGLVFLCLHAGYFEQPVWVLERTLDNETILRRAEPPAALSESQNYRCVQETGAPVRLSPSLESPPVGRLRCGSLIPIAERYINPQRQMFLRIGTQNIAAKEDEKSTCTYDGMWVIETTTCCSSVMIKARRFDEIE